MRVTIKDIAKTANVSVTTVSMVLNGKDKGYRISENTKQHILKVANEMNYRPNRLAVSLVTKKSNTIGLIVPDISNLFFAELAQGCEREGAKRGYSIILCDTNDDKSRDIEYFRVLTDMGVDGIIYAMSSQIKFDHLSDILTSLHTPLVFVDRLDTSDHYSNIAIDHRLGGYLATKHLIENGHTKIGCITGDLNSYTAHLRFDGYKAALSDFNIEFMPQYIKEGDYRTYSGEKAALELFKEDITAIFSSNDMMAYGVYKAASSKKLNIPNDISVIGFDDVFFSTILDTPLTSISQPVHDIGINAVNKVIGLSDKTALNEQIILNPKLVERNSVKNINFER